LLESNQAAKDANGIATVKTVACHLFMFIILDLMPEIPLPQMGRMTSGQKYKDCRQGKLCIRK